MFSRLQPRHWLSAAALLASMPALALQAIEARDGMSVEAIVSTKEATRIRLEGTPITDVFGNIYSSNCAAAPAAAGAPTPASPAVNPTGEIVLECDRDKGEVYVRPVGNSAKPINLFVSSANATYTLLLRKSDVPADTIVIRDKTPRQAKAEGVLQVPAGRSSSHIRSLKAMLIAMASDRVPTDLRVDEVNIPRALWAEAKFTLLRVIEGRGLIGEKYLLTNVSNATMVLAEQEFDREEGNVLAVSIDNLNLRPGESTNVYVIRMGS
ncbi:type-F conjugative transfer system secretin TraK [Herbaspirillum sp. ST 5-3]|uniref:type-F conjugative transfer system secretin TraK n=1 Tax=Oxalobacteraceae TaxID=75682 RepID=UPI0010A500E7|nr:type-F conjugative transfer system secretin TraK [Herbaspirillum sp. ST 5-3]